MKLRSCNHSHFIQAVKGGLVTKILNVTHGRPALTFKKVKDIYETVDAKNHDFLPTIQPKVEFESLSFDNDGVEVEGPCLYVVERRTIKSEPETSDLFCEGSDNRSNSDLDDLGFSTMTLKQIKDRCKTKKRKHSKDGELSQETVETSSCSKQESSNFLSGEEDFDLQEPLIRWKAKLSKNMKVKKKCTKNRVSTLSQSAISIVDSEQVPSDQDFLQSSRDLQAAINIQVEVPEPYCLDDRNTICVAGDSSLGCDELEGSCGMVSSEVHVAANECVMGTQVSIASIKELRYCVINEECHEYMESATQVSISSTEEPQHSVFYEECHEYMESANPKSVQISDPCWDTKKADDTKPTGHECSNLPVPESEKEGCIIRLVSHDISLETVSSLKDHSSYMSGISQSSSPMHEMSLQINNVKVQEPHVTIQKSPQGVELDYEGDAFDNDKVQEPHVTIQKSPQDMELGYEGDAYDNVKVQELHVTIHKSPQGVELGYEGDAYVFEDGTTAVLPSNPEVSVIASSGSNCSLSTYSCLDSAVDDSPAAEEKQLQMSACANADINVSAGIHPCDAADELTTPIGSGDCHYLKPQHPPERLFSTRKAISPTSQERLRKAMDSIELHDNNHYKCRGKISSGKNKIGRVGHDQIGRDEFNINPQKITRKPKNDKRGSHPKGAHKGAYLSRAVPRFSTGCTSIQSCSQSAIEFSQQQMHDMECLAMKLIKELKSMKDIVEERLLPEVCPASSLKNNVDKARVVIGNATRVEEGTKRWLSMMARDCSRFCKIMRLTEKGSASSGNVVPKERKKSTSTEKTGGITMDGSQRSTEIVSPCFTEETGGIIMDGLQRSTEIGSPSSGNAVHKERKRITFADEAGGKLCHVRVFEDDMASLLECKSEKQELPLLKKEKQELLVD